MSKVYDVIVLGAGPAGLAAGLYAGRSRLSTLVIEKGKDGGQIAITDDIENYPGQIVEGESGPSLIARMTQQCEKFGVERASDVINEVHLDGDIKVRRLNISQRRLSSQPELLQDRSDAKAKKSSWARAFLTALPVMQTSLKILKYT